MTSIAFLLLAGTAPAGAWTSGTSSDAPIETADAGGVVQLASMFPDVPGGSTHSVGIAAVARAGITTGCGGGRFCPRDEVTRDQMATFLYRALGLPAGSVAGFSDVSSNGTHAAGIGAVAQAGITTGCGGGRFCPSDPVTRDQMATFLYRALDLEGYPAASAQTISTGTGHTCALANDGQVWCWGDNRRAQAGIDVGFPAVPSPHLIASVSDAVDISAHGNLSCAVRRTGGVACWGANQFGLLGGGTASNAMVVPVPVVGISDAVAVRGDAYSDPYTVTCVQHANGGTSCWGINANLGDGISYVDREDYAVTTPVRTLLRDALEISVGGAYVCGRHPDGGVSCWGSNSAGQTGQAIGYGGNLLRPQRTSWIGDVIEIETGRGTTCARTGDGEVRCWGNNSDGQVGNGTAGSAVTTPYRVAALAGAQQVSIGHQHACAVLGTGAVSCWGENGSGQLGDGTTADRYTPTRVPGIANAVEVSAGLWHSCARLADGRVMCWGNNTHGQLGDGGRGNSLTPVEVDVINLGRR